MANYTLFTLNNSPYYDLEGVSICPATIATLPKRPTRI